MKKLNLGCGWNKMKGFINIDCTKVVKPDLVMDLNKGLKRFKTNSVNYIYSAHTLEHILPCHYQELLKEMYRVSKHGATWELILPFDNIGSRTHEEHFRTFGFYSFCHYNKSGIRKYYSGGIWLERINKIPCKIVRMFYTIFPYLKSEIRFVFKVVKGRK